MSIRYISDRSGTDIPEGEHRKVWISITLDSQYVSEPIKFKRSWDMTVTEELAVRPDAVTMRNAIEAAAQAFINAVENP
jgi:hypothetical protein